jgi:hypothetical protein
MTMKDKVNHPGPDTAAELTRLAEWIAEQLGGETADRQWIAEGAAARVRDIRLNMLGAPDTAAALRDALAAVAEALDVPRGDVPGMEARNAWLEERSDRATIAAITIEWILKPEAERAGVAHHVRYLREQIAARSGL